MDSPETTGDRLYHPTRHLPVLPLISQTSTLLCLPKRRPAAPKSHPTPERSSWVPGHRRGSPLSHRTDPVHKVHLGPVLCHSSRRVHGRVLHTLLLVYTRGRFVGRDIFRDTRYRPRLSSRLQWWGRTPLLPLTRHSVLPVRGQVPLPLQVLPPVVECPHRGPVVPLPHVPEKEPNALHLSRVRLRLPDPVRPLDTSLPLQTVPPGRDGTLGLPSPSRVGLLVSRGSLYRDRTR